MAIDVLEVNKIRTGSDVANTRANVTTIAAATTNVSSYVCYNNLWNNPDYWDTYFPAAPVGGTVLCIGCMRVGTDATLNCGVCCLWTVPNGVTVAKFEVWGAGAGTLPGCCCSIQPFGATGSYATICMPVTAGVQYTICAGAAHTCSPCNGITGRLSCASYVVGTSLCCLCAAGGSGCQPYFNIAKAYRGFTCNLDCYMFNVATDRCLYTDSYCGMAQASYMYGICICSFGESCFSTGTTTNATVSSMPSIDRCSTYGHGVLASGEVRKAIGIPSRYPEFCFSSGTLCGYVKHPPIPGFVSTSQCCVSWSSLQSTFGGAACSPLNGINYLTAPGSGGNMVYTVSGCNSNYGDTGRGGMVRITYC